MVRSSFVLVQRREVFCNLQLATCEVFEVIHIMSRKFEILKSRLHDSQDNSLLGTIREARFSLDCEI